MKKALAIGTLLLLAAGAAGWYLLKSQSAATPSVQGVNTQQERSPLNPNVHSFFDVDFAQKMSLHHQQGIEIADVVLDSSGTQSIRTMATAMRAQQSAAEVQYKLWIEEWDGTYRNLADFPQMDGHDMYPSYPGLVSAVKLGKLKSASGSELDKLFLELMTEHHKGGIQLGEASNRLQYGRLIDYKNEVLDNYETELQQMEKE